MVPTTAINAKGRLKTWRPLQEKHKELKHCFLEEFTGPEFRLYGSLDLDLFTRLWIPAFARGALRNTERTETRNRDFFAAGHRLYDGVEHCVNGALSSSFGFDTGRFHDRLGQSFLVHAEYVICLFPRPLAFDAFSIAKSRVKCYIEDKV